MITLEGGYVQSRFMGVTPDPYKIVETDEHYMFMMPTPGLSDKNISVKVTNNTKLVILSKASSMFTPKFKFVFLLPEGVKKEEIEAYITDGVLHVKMFKNKS